MPDNANSTDKLVLALPKGRILSEVMPVVRRAGIEPEPAFDDPESRLLRFATNLDKLEIIRVRSFDVATFVAFGAAQLAGSNLPQHATFAHSKEDVLNALSFYFGQPVAPEKLRDYSEHHAM